MTDKIDIEYLINWGEETEARGDELTAVGKVGGGGLTQLIHRASKTSPSLLKDKTLDDVIYMMEGALMLGYVIARTKTVEEIAKIAEDISKYRKAMDAS